MAADYAKFTVRLKKDGKVYISCARVMEDGSVFREVREVIKGTPVAGTGVAMLEATAKKHATWIEQKASWVIAQNITESGE